MLLNLNDFNFCLLSEKPVILDGPKDTTVQEGAHALLQCQGTGDPEPVVVWKKLEGQVPAERLDWNGGVL